ncbi:MAG: hypothetical protein HKN11_00405 [Rhizobiales bacterium]|nr:hypothetical protein [Hyphomicrobiales bacterium]
MINLKKPLAIACATAFLSTAAIAAEGDFVKADTDTDGALTYQEVLALMPDMTAEQFKAADGNGDGTLSQAEFEAVTG